MSFDSDGIKHILPEDIFAFSGPYPDLTRSIQIPTGYELVGLES